MTPRLEDPVKVASPEVIKAMFALESTLRASRINGCAFRIHAHASKARKAGETETRHALTRLPDSGAPDEDCALVKAQFNPTEQADPMLAIGAINLWNRLKVGFRALHPADPARAAA